ncbi:MAG TPA: cytochrome c [Myxococcaceae bacterium]|nr:cytochrome c [Myxococcaceae bacterium]
MKPLRDAKSAALAAVLACASTALAAAGSDAGASPEASPAGILFGQKCLTCHNVGEGNKIGPDLLGVDQRRELAWLKRWLASPGAMLDAKDPTALELLGQFNNVRMPEQNLAPEQIEGLLAFFAACTEKDGCIPVGGPKLAIDATPEEIAAGREYFIGTRRFSAGGPACAGCHDVRGEQLLGGGSLGGDLTFVWAHRHEKGLEEAILASPVEKQAYAGRAPTDVENFSVRGYLASLSRDGTRPTRSRDLLDLGVLGACAVIGALAIGWRARSSGNGGGQG